MQTMPSDYLDAMRGDVRQVDVFLSIGRFSDLTAADDYDGTTAGMLEMSNPDAQLTDAIYEITEGLATFEGYGIATAIDAGNIAPPIQAEHYPPETALWSDVISDADGNVEWSFTVAMAEPHTSALTFHTRQVDILEAFITIRNNGSVVVPRTEMTVARDRVTYSQNVTYDSFTVEVTKVAQPFMHVRIAEIEFGTQTTFSKEDLTGTVSIIREYDPTMLSIPLHELDFSILNVLGEWDVDSPDSAIDSLAQSLPISAAFTCVTGEKNWTVNIGRFFISSLSGAETQLDVTCFDGRKTLQDIYTTWELNTEQSLGTQITDIFTSAYIPHTVDAALFQLYADAPYTFTDNMSLLEVFLYLMQYYNVWLVPGRNGSISVRLGPPMGDYGDMDPDMEYTFPKQAQFTKYNFIQVAYQSGNTTSYYSMDLRTTSTEAKSQISISNPLVRSVTKAQEIAARVASSLYSTMVEMEWRTDLTVDPGDTAGLFGKWSQDTATEYRVSSSRIEYTGAVKETLKGVK